MNVPILEMSLESWKFGLNCTQKAFEEMTYKGVWDGTFLGLFIIIILMLIISITL